LGFILNSWLKSYRTSDFGKNLSNEIYYENYNHVVREIFQSAETLLACNNEDPDQIYGHIVFNRPNIIHYVYVKQFCRKLGIANALVKAAGLDVSSPIICTHTNKCFPEIRGRHSNLIYNPFLLRNTA
jgi:hypothetical protein